MGRKEELWGNGGEESRISHAVVSMRNFYETQDVLSLIQLVDKYLSGPDQNLKEANVFS